MRGPSTTCVYAGTQPDQSRDFHPTPFDSMTAITTCHSWLHRRLRQRPQLLDWLLIRSCLLKPPVLTWCPAETCWRTDHNYSSACQACQRQQPEVSTQSSSLTSNTHKQYLAHICKIVRVHTHTQTHSMFARQPESWSGDRWLDAVMFVAMETQKQEPSGDNVNLPGQFQVLEYFLVQLLIKTSPWL